MTTTGDVAVGEASFIGVLDLRRGSAGFYGATPSGRDAVAARRHYDLAMTSGEHDESPWQDQSHNEGREELLAPSTQIVSDREDYLGQGARDVGRRISADQVELFASVDAAVALEIEFTQHAPLFLAVHDVGTSASLRLLSSIANATSGRVHKLSIRRQGHGLALAVLQFVEMPLADGSRVRVYSTDFNGDPQTRWQIARVMLAFSRLGVLLVGGLAAPALSAALQPMHDAILAGPWSNRELLMVPLGSGMPLAAQAAQLASQGQVAVHVTPTAGKTRQAWSYIGGAWNRLSGGAGGAHTIQVEIGTSAPPPPPAEPSSEQATVPMGLQPAHPAAAPQAANAWQSYVDSCALLKGAVACCAFDTLSMQPLAHAGPAATAAPLAEQGAKLLRSMSEATRAFGLASAPSDASITAAGHHLLLRPVPGHPGVALHLVLTSTSNLTLSKMQLDRISPPPSGTPHAAEVPPAS